MRTEALNLSLTHFQAKDEDATDSADITTQVYAEKYSVVVTPTAWMIAHGENAILICEYIIKTDPGTGTVSVRTLVDGADGVEKTGLTIGSGEQRAVHTDIVAVALALGTSYTVSLEAKNSDSGQTSVIDYFNVYLQIGTSSTGIIPIAKIADIKSISLDITIINYSVVSEAVATASFTILKDGLYGSLLSDSSSNAELQRHTSGVEMLLGVINDYLDIRIGTDDADNPAILEVFSYTRVWFE